MTVSDAKRSAEVVESALVTVARAAGSEHPTVRIWLVWISQRRVMSWEWINRLDLAVPAFVPAGADEVVVVAVAPTRVAGAVIGRVDVICEQVEATGVVAAAVHVSALQEGALWTPLHGSGFGGIVPALTGPGGTAARRRRFPRFTRAAMPRRMAIVSMTPIVGILFALTGNADPGGQAGVIAAPSPGQAGVKTTTPSAQSQPVPPAEPVLVTQNSQPSSSSPGQANPRVSSAPAWDDDDPDQPLVNDVEDDTVRVGAAAIPRPDWMPRELAGPQRAWNDYLAYRAAIELNEAEGLIGAGADVLNGVGLTDLVDSASEAAQAAVADVSAVVGSGQDGEPRQGIAELTVIAAGALPQWENPVPQPDVPIGESTTGEPVLSQVQEEVEGWLSELPPPLG